MLYYRCKEKEVEMLNKVYFLKQFNEDILNCRNAQKYERYETAAFYRGCAQGMATAMYWANCLSVTEYNKLNERLRRSITMEEDIMWKSEKEYWEEFNNWILQFRDDFEDRPEDWDLFYTQQVEQASKEAELYF